MSALKKNAPTTNWMRGDPRPARHGWAPGEYLCRCTGDGCKDKDAGVGIISARQFLGAKRSFMCANCAYALPDAPPLPQRRPIDEMVAAYNKVWDAAGAIDAENVAEIRHKAMTEAFWTVVMMPADARRDMVASKVMSAVFLNTERQGDNAALFDAIKGAV